MNSYPKSGWQEKKAKHGTLEDWLYLKNEWQGFPGGAVVKNPPANAGDMGSIPSPGRPHMP